MNWRERAACAGMPTNLFFPEGPNAATLSRTARDVCASCPVQAECHATAIANREQFGIWGGESFATTIRQRRSHPGEPRRNAAKCGTTSGYTRHLRNGEHPCDACKQANATYKANGRARGYRRAS